MFDHKASTFYQCNHQFWIMVLTTILSMMVGCAPKILGSGTTLPPPLPTACPKRIYSIAFSPNGQVLASGTDKVWLWQVKEGTLLSALEDQAGWVKSVAFTPDGRILASGSLSGVIQLWQVADGTLLRTLQHGRVVGSVIFSPDGALLASFAWDDPNTGSGTVRLWRVDNGELVYTLNAQTIRKDESPSLAFSPDGKILASNTQNERNGYIQLWQVTDGTPLYTLEGHGGSVSSIAFSPDGMLLASASIDNTIRLWRISDGTFLRMFEIPCQASGKQSPDCSYYLRNIAFDPDGEVLAAGGEYGHIVLLRIADGVFLRELGGHKESILSVAFAPDGETLASASKDGTVKLWRVSDGTLLRELQHEQFEHCPPTQAMPWLVD